MAIPDKVLEGIDRLEPLPITVQRLLVALNDEDINLSEIAEAIEYDGAITSNILRTANSAAYGGRSRIEHVRDAVVRLGTVTLLDIMLMGHFRTMRFSAPHHGPLEDQLWLHGATASLAVKAISKETRNRKIPQAATISALIHDIGKLILLRYFNAEPAAIQAKCQEMNLSPVEAERELLGCDHAEVGGAMAHRWAFPEPITVVIERHHDASYAEENLMLDAVILANQTSKAVTSGFEEAGAALLVECEASARRFGMTLPAFERICSQTQLWQEDLKRSYGIPD